MKAEDLKAKTVDELTKLLLDKRKEQFNLRFQRSQGSLEKTAEIRKVRRMIAQIKTFLNQKQAEEGGSPAPTPKKPSAKKTTTTKKKAADTAKKSSKKAA